MNAPPSSAAGADRLPAALLVFALVVVGGLGVWSRDLGDHWDEGRILGAVRTSFETGLMLPHWYNYPSLAYDIAILAAVPRVLGRAAPEPDLRAPRTASPERGGREFQLELRAVFFLLCTLAGLAAFLLARRLSGDAWAALFSALTVVTSWEFFYHARWIAPDGLVMVFAAFSLWAQHAVLESGDAAVRRRWIAKAAIFAGLATGSKYPGGIVLLPLLLAIVLAPRSDGSARFGPVRESAFALWVAAATFAITTPGSLLEPMTFVTDVATELAHYRAFHGGHTVGAGWPHFILLADYIGRVLFSRQPVLAVLGAALALAGAVDIARTRPRLAVWLLSMPVAFVVFISSQRVMIVRNDLLLLPPLAVLAGLGLAACRRATAGGRVLRLAAAAVAIVLIGYNFAGVIRSAWSVVSPNRTKPEQAVEQRIRSSPETRFLLSNFVTMALWGSSVLGEANVVATMDSADQFLFWNHEFSEWEQDLANRRGRYRTVWKYVDDVNWDYYPDWTGHHRVLEISARSVRRR